MSIVAVGDDEKGSKVIDRFKDEITAVELGEGWNFADIDSAEDLESASA